jgi:tRNA/rRNA methyltransferase
MTNVKNNTAPVIILVHPQLGENIGAVARAMTNFGAKELRLVAPRDGWPNQKAWDMASGAEAILEAAQVFPDFPSALADIELAYATSARPRDMEKRVVMPEEAMQEILPPPIGERLGGGHSMGDVSHIKPPPQPSPYGGGRIALVFGPERTGLENDHIVLCDAVIAIPTAPEKASLNLAQSAVVVLYEWFKQRSEVRDQGSGKEKTFTDPRPPTPAPSATKADWQGLFDQLDGYLETIEYYREPSKKPMMWQNMRNMFLRGQWNEQEIRTFRGMLRVLYEGRQHGAKKSA